MQEVLATWAFFSCIQKCLYTAGERPPAQNVLQHCSWYDVIEAHCCVVEIGRIALDQYVVESIATDCNMLWSRQILQSALIDSATYLLNLPNNWCAHAYVKCPHAMPVTTLLYDSVCLLMNQLEAHTKQVADTFNAYVFLAKGLCRFSCSGYLSSTLFTWIRNRVNPGTTNPGSTRFNRSM